MRARVGIRYGSEIIIIDELKTLQLDAYRLILDNLLACGAFWDGMLLAREALKVFPDNVELKDTQQILVDAFRDRSKSFVENTAKSKKKADMIYQSREGRIYQKRYPWMDEKLFIRTPALVKQANKSLKKRGIEVRPVIFDTPGNISSAKVSGAKKFDVGPLGVFALRDFAPDELVMIDDCITGVSNIPSSHLQHCDACHASIIAPYIHPQDIVRPTCCTRVAFCSRTCHDTAVNSYHSVLCGKDIDWVYQPLDTLIPTNGTGVDWIPAMFLRFASIILATQRKNKNTYSEHPLQHPLVARMTANYPNKQLSGSSFVWRWHENVVAPTKILLQLGVDIYVDAGWSQEVVQTLYWRCENNANLSFTDLSSPPSSSSSSSFSSQTQE